MIYRLSILIRTEERLDQLAQELEQLLQISLERKADEYDAWYEHDNDDVYLVVAEHELENDRELRFEDYRYDLTIWSKRRPGVEQYNKRWRDDLAPAIFNKLTATGRYELLLYDLLLMEGVQTKLNEFHPRRAAVAALDRQAVGE